MSQLIKRILVSGYVRQNACTYIPNGIIQMITLFAALIGYNNIIPCDVYSSDGKRKTPHAIKDVIDVIINRESIFYICKNGGIYVSGNNAYGQLGTKHQSYGAGNTIIKPHNYAVKFMSKGINAFHTFIYTIDHKLYGCGASDFNQLGIALKKTSIHVPTLITYPFDSKITQISCGQNHSIFLTVRGSVYSAGANFKGETQITTNNDKQYIIHIKILNDITFVDCGDNTSYCVDKNGVLYTFGNNAVGQLGIGNTEPVTDVQQVSDIKAEVLSAGYCHAGMISRDNNVYTFGGNNRGQCGVGNYSDILRPSRININQALTVKSGNQHIIVKTLKGEFYSFGDNSYKQCCININDKKICKPTKIVPAHLMDITHNNAAIIDLIPGRNITYILLER
mmetsp:Transcript_104171/g.127276  ORF Transcript_104171/g.127276 Transcript_104171/m.127276 type:complete len:394 (+) Transcript_104171:53-1234(+)